MKQIQGKKIIGFVTFIVKGIRPEHFLEVCVNQEIPVWDVKKQDSHTCEAKIYLHHINRMKEINEKFNNRYEISFINRRGYLFFIQQLLRKKQIVTAFILSILTLLVLSNLIWTVKIQGVSHEIEEKIIKELSQQGIRTGSWSFSIRPLQTIQQNVLNEVPELLWLGIEKQGTSFHVEGVEKKIVEDREAISPQHLIASKHGIVQKMYVSQGLPLVKVHDYVKQGDMLVSGVIYEHQALEESDEDSEKTGEIVRATGEVFANTWYEVGVIVPLNVDNEILTGQNQVYYKLQVGNIRIPVWGFKKPDYKSVHHEEKTNKLYFLKWKLPFEVVQTNIHEKVHNIEERTKQEARKIGIKQAKEDLQLRLGTDAQILSDYILHEAVENGKVKLNLYMSVLENIAVGQDIK